MKRALLVAAATLLIAGTAIAQTTSPTNPQQRRGAVGDTTQTPPTIAEQQRCDVYPTGAEREKCLRGLMPPGTPSLSQSPQPMQQQPAR